MITLKRIFLAAMVAFAPVAGHAAVGAPPAPVTAPASETAAPADTDSAPAFEHARPVDGVGQPISGGVDFQPQVTENGEYAYWLNNVVLLPIITVISLLVLGLMLWIMVRYRAAANPNPSTTTHNTFIEIVWTLIPVLILAGVSVPSIDLLARQYAPPPADAVTIKVTGYQWYWGYEYPDHGVPEMVSRMLDRPAAEANGEPFQLAVDNRMVVPVGQWVKLIVTGSDVIHSFAVPALWTKMDAVPGRLNEVTFRAMREGVYYGQCSELCGVDHGYMPIAVEVVSAARFAQWVASKGGTMPGAAAPTIAPASAAPVTATPASPAPVAPAASPVAAH
ncbi:MAG: cytochrome c oxidase subunit II [Sphingopyxis sp.]